MPFRDTFDCLWCGAPHTTRSPSDLEGWASLCPTCIGRAGENAFLRSRLRAALAERGRTLGSTPAPAPGVGGPVPGRAVDARPSDGGAGGPATGRGIGQAPLGPPLVPPPDDDWYLRRGAWSQGAIDDALWAADLDAATLWLDGVDLSGVIVELDAGTGWWSPLLASKGELWIFDAEPAALDAARSRLVGHGLRAHLHERDAAREPDRAADALVTTFWLGRRERSRWPSMLALAHRWLRPGGRYAFLELRPGPASAARAGGPRPLDIEPWALEAALAAAGFREVELAMSRSLLSGIATA